jgi:hypothetical protein
LQWRGWIPAASHVVSGILFGALLALACGDCAPGSYGGGSPSASCGTVVGLVSRAPDLVVPETFEKARRVAPGWDIYFLEGLWRDWIAGKEEPKNPDAAFIAFCRKKYQRRGVCR